MAAHIGDMPALANRIAGALYLRLASGRARHVSLIHAEPGPADTVTLTERSLLPFDFNRFPGGSRALPPLVTLPPARLLEQLAEEYVFAELCAALMLSFAAENEARMRAMIGARSNVLRTRDMLRATYRRLRQEQITTEIVELAAGRMAQGDDGKGSRLNPS
jgi:F-type H+-transporting ATPase subunit gamma